jgi:5-methylcytosine-specific restriction endonuclease McrA
MRAGGEKRGNSRDRARRKVWLLETFDTDLGPDRARCHLKVSAVCSEVVDRYSLTADRINPGGTYAHENVQPACRPCQNTQGALITRERRQQWREWMAEAKAAGIEWDGVMA